MQSPDWFTLIEQWKALQTPAEAEATWEHIIRSPAHSIEKARRLLGYQPRYTSLDAVYEAVAWLVDNGRVYLYVGHDEASATDTGWGRSRSRRDARDDRRATRADRAGPAPGRRHGA